MNERNWACHFTFKSTRILNSISWRNMKVQKLHCKVDFIFEMDEIDHLILHLKSRRVLKVISWRKIKLQNKHCKVDSKITWKTTLLCNQVSNQWCNFKIVFKSISYYFMHGNISNILEVIQWLNSMTLSYWYLSKML